MAKMFAALLLFFLLPVVIHSRCCVPEKMTGDMDTYLHSSEYMKHVFDVGKFHIDFAAQKVMVYNLDKMPVVDYIIVDFGKGKKYVRMDDGSCEASDFSHIGGFQRCVPQFAHDWNLGLGIKNAKTSWWSFGLDNAFTTVSEYKIDKSTCLPERIALRWDTNDWPYQWDLSNINASVPSDSNLYKDTSDCVMK